VGHEREVAKLFDEPAEHEILNAVVGDGRLAGPVVLVEVEIVENVVLAVNLDGAIRVEDANVVKAAAEVENERPANVAHLPNLVLAVDDERVLEREAVDDGAAHVG
jgi:hypothetical protein